MTFQDALTAMQAGHRVRRLGWPQYKYMRLAKDIFIGCADDGASGLAPMQFAIALLAADVLADDWKLAPP